MDILIKNIGCIHSDEDTGDLGDIKMHADDDVLFIDVKSGDKLFTTYLDKKQLIQYRNALTCFIDSNLIEDEIED